MSLKLTHKRYSKLVSRVLLETDPAVLLEISFMSVTQNRPTSVTPNKHGNVTEIDLQTLLRSTHKCYSTWRTNVARIHKRYSNWATNVTRNKPTNITQIDLQVLVKLIHKRYSKTQTLLSLTQKRYSNWSTNVTQNCFNKQY